MIAAEVYVHLNKETEATACVKEANLLFPRSPDVFFQVGQNKLVHRYIMYLTSTATWLLVFILKFLTFIKNLKFE